MNISKYGPVSGPPLPTTELQQVFFFFLMKLKALMHISPQTFVMLIICLEDFFFHLEYVTLFFLTLKFSLEHDFEWFHKMSCII